MDERTKAIMELVLEWYANTSEGTSVTSDEIVDLVDRLVELG